MEGHAANKIKIFITVTFCYFCRRRRYVRVLKISMSECWLFSERKRKRGREIPRSKNFRHCRNIIVLPPRSLDHKIFTKMLINIVITYFSLSMFSIFKILSFDSKARINFRRDVMQCRATRRFTRRCSKIIINHHLIYDGHILCAITVLLR